MHLTAEQAASVTANVLISFFFVLLAFRALQLRLDTCIGFKRLFTSLVAYCCVSAACVGYWAYAVAFHLHTLRIFVVMGRAGAVGFLFYVYEAYRLKVIDALRVSQKTTQDIEKKIEENTSRNRFVAADLRRSRFEQLRHMREREQRRAARIAG